MRFYVTAIGAGIGLAAAVIGTHEGAFSAVLAGLVLAGFCVRQGPLHKDF